ncbi:MAG: MBL fold metallo-hydrolase [Betaproteobacteria bacterium]|nr:MBL fold metallo-hydrolase [Betaproteobacteria bacterium]
MNEPAIPIRPAATIILCRDTAQGLEVFMMRRSPNSVFMSGVYVFPGGALDDGDDPSHWGTHELALDDTVASRVLAVDRNGLAYWIGALRECFEESGLLLGYNDRGEILSVDEEEQVNRFAELRRKLNAGETTFQQICREHGVRLAVDRMAYFSHWVTPPNEKRRYDTRFFTAVAPAQQSGSHDDAETTDNTWIRPQDALERFRRGEFALVFPTIKTLERLARFRDAAALMAHTRALPSVAPIHPHVAIAADGSPRRLIPGDHAYAEIGKRDPQGRGDQCCEIVPGVTVALSPAVRRITAPNPGMMTGPGTNSYIIGRISGRGDATRFAVLDPGPDLPQHVDALLAATGGRIGWVLATHTHRDHSPAAAMIKARLGKGAGVEFIGRPPPDEERQDQSFQPDHIVNDGDRISVAGCAIRVIATPGHASNQCCYLLEEEKLLFTGDHIMQGSTVVIIPPDGNMAVYMAALRKLQGEDLEWLAPGHGYLIGAPQVAIERLLVHRQSRENKVVEALRALGEPGMDALVATVYDDVPPALHPMASRSLLAHLIKLQDEGRAAEAAGRWRAKG